MMTIQNGSLQESATVLFLSDEEWSLPVLKVYSALYYIMQQKLP